MAKSHPLYKEMPELYLLMGNYEEVKEKPLNAIPLYNRAIEYGSIDGYLASANIYEQMGQYEWSIMVLETGWNIHSDTRLLTKLIYILCKIERSEAAIERYQELKKVDQDDIPPFLIFKGSIENDEELDVFEEVIAKYISE